MCACHRIFYIPIVAVSRCPVKWCLPRFVACVDIDTLIQEELQQPLTAVVRSCMQWRVVRPIHLSSDGRDFLNGSLYVCTLAIHQCLAQNNGLSL